MEYSISLQQMDLETAKIGKIVFASGKEVNFRIDEQGHFIPDRNDAWFGIGADKQFMTIKQAMGIPEDSCCCNPRHAMKKEVMEAIALGAEKHAEYMRSRVPVSKEVIIPQKEKIEDEVDRVDRRKKLSDHDVAIIRQSTKKSSILAELFGVAEITIKKIRGGDRR